MHNAVCRSLAGYESPYIVNFPYLEIYNDKCRFIMTEGLVVHNNAWLTQLRPTDYVFCILPWNPGLGHWQGEKRVIEHFHLNLEHIIPLCNTKEQEATSRSLGFNSIFVNHNAFHDPTLFAPRNQTKIYDAVYITRPVKWKRPELAKLITNMAYLQSHVHSCDKLEVDLALLPHAFLNPTFFNANQVAAVLNQTRVGLALSPEEGACYASSEYLMSGLPVVSTASRGGRDVWYNEYNSIITAATPEAVRENVYKLIELNRDPQKIAQEHWFLAQQFRKTFTDKLDEILKQNEIPNTSGQQIFEKSYRHQYKNYGSWDELITQLLK